MKIFLIWIIVCNFKGILGQNQAKYSPCPETFEYEYVAPGSDTWYGVLHLQTNVVLHGVFIDIILDRRAINLGTYYRDVTTRDNIEFRIDDRSFKLRPDERLDLKFTVKYDVQLEAPQVKEIRLNGQKICSVVTRTVPRSTEIHETGTNLNRNVGTIMDQRNINQGSRPGQSSTVRQPGFEEDVLIKDIFQISDNSNKNNNNRINSSQERDSNNRNFYDSNSNNSNSRGQNSRTDYSTERYSPTTTKRRSITSGNNGYVNIQTTQSYERVTTERTTTRGAYFAGDLHTIHSSGWDKPSLQPSLPRNSFETCGVVAQKSNPLIVSGDESYKGQFPWHAALYISTGTELRYVCGGNLISKFVILTAAHCVTLKDTTRAMTSDNLLIYLGKYYLRKWTGPEQDVKVANILVHPNYNYEGYYSDLAILKLKTEAKYNEFVRPICLWSFDDDLKAVVNKLGRVPGWGYNENGLVSENLSYVNMPIVTHETCIWSNRDFFSRITSDMSFCAGFRNGSSVCNGDSGGGMVFKENGKWHLRGIVSVSLALQNRLKCDPNNYVVFTDVAKFVDWIKNNI